jgi:hypothetical protein
MTNKKELDPVTFEVIRHRLGSINDEAALALLLTSGSAAQTGFNSFA